MFALRTSRSNMAIIAIFSDSDELRSMCRELTKEAERGALEYKSLLIIYLVAERVGFELSSTIENKDLHRFSLPHDPLDPHENPGRDTY